MSDDTTDDLQTGVVIVALPRDDDPVQKIGPEQKHATLLYFGDIPRGANPNELLTADALSLMVQVLTVAAATYGPITESVTSVEQLGDAGARVWMLQGTELPDLRADLLDTDHELVGILEAVEQYPSYTPHVTIGYDQPAPDQQTQADGAESLTVSDDDLADAAAIESITFDRLALWWAGEQLEYPLTGTADPGRGSAVAEHQPGGPMPKPITERGRLLEATAGKGAAATRRNIQIITPGWGSSGYYSPEVLERAATNKVIPAGTHMYLNHASESERHDRPERDVEKIAAVLVEDATWDGRRLAAPADLMGPHAELIESLAPYIGVSISGSATDITVGEAEGRRGPIIEDLAYVESVDFVTHAGRGGMVLLESARPSIVNARAVSHGVAEATVNDTRDQLQNLVRDAYGGENTYVWVRDFDDSTVWFDVESPDDCGTYGQGYAQDDAGATSLTGERSEVRARTQYVPVTPDDTSTRTEEAQPMAEEQTGQTETDTTTQPQAATESAAASGTQTPGATPEQAATGSEPVAESTHPSPTKENTMTEQNPGAGGSAPAQEAGTTSAAPTNPRQVLEQRLNEQGQQIRLLRAGQQARGIVAHVLGDGWIAESTKARLTNELTAEAVLPLTEAGELDEAVLQARATEVLHQAEVEAAETLSAFGHGKVRGLGATESTGFGSAAGEGVNPYAGSLSESFKELGLSESAVETATKGR